MHKTMAERISGDTAGGVSYDFPVFRFDGSRPSARCLHPGGAARRRTAGRRRDRRADAEAAPGRGRAPHPGQPHHRAVGQPVGRTQYLFGDRQGRFHLGTRTNFNRDFPLLDGRIRLVADLIDAACRPTSA